MKLVVLGCGGYHPSAQRHTACLLLPDIGVMLDAGTGMFRAAEHLVTPELDIFLTHAHLDHVVGLTFLFSTLWVRPMDSVRVHASADRLEALDQHLFAEPLFPTRPPMAFVPLCEREPLADGGVLTHFPLIHPGESRGFRLDWPGHSLAYVTDTTAKPGAGYIEAIRGVDLLLHECYFTDDQADWATKTGHSCSTAVGQVARQAGVKRLVLVHVRPTAPPDDPVGLAAIRAQFPNADVAEDGMELEF